MNLYIFEGFLVGTPPFFYPKFLQWYFQRSLSEFFFGFSRDCVQICLLKIKIWFQKDFCTDFCSYFLGFLWWFHFFKAFLQGATLITRKSLMEPLSGDLQSTPSGGTSLGSSYWESLEELISKVLQWTALGSPPFRYLQESLWNHSRDSSLQSPSGFLSL